MRKKLKKTTFVACAFVTIIILLAAIMERKHYNMNISRNIKYVLIWTRTKKSLFSIRPGSKIFHKRNCPIRNCYITWNRTYTNNISVFDAITFYGPDIVEQIPEVYFPKERYAHQNYIFASDESSHNYKVPDTRFHGIFNFTWTYKLNSDISCKYLAIRNREGKIVGPNKTIDWIRNEDMLSINDSIKRKLAKKSIAAAWFVSHCKTPSRRESLAFKIAAELEKYNMTLDIYGGCGHSKYCPLTHQSICLQKLRRDYYFYLAFENSFGEDYVTEKLLIALQNYVVPVVYGGANYKRFMPDGIYLDARKISPVKLAKRIVEIIRNKEKYYDFFKWHNHYSYHDPKDSPETDPYCSLCSFINNINRSKGLTIEDLYGRWNIK